MLQRFVGHNRAEVGTADPDVDNVSNALARVAFPSAASDAVPKIGHLVEDSLDLHHDILSDDQDTRTFWSPQGNVQDRALFRSVDLLSLEHGFDPRPQIRFFGESHKEFHRLVSDSIL